MCTAPPLSLDHSPSHHWEEPAQESGLPASCPSCFPGQGKTNLESPNSQPLFLSPLHSPTHAERDWNRLAQPGKPRAAEGEAMKDGRKSGQPQVLSSRHGASSHGWQAAHRPLGYTSTGRGTRAQNLCEAEGRESFCSLCAAPLLWRKGTQRCWCVLSELLLTCQRAPPHVEVLGSSAVSEGARLSLPNEPWHCLTAKQAHSHR